MKKVKTEKKKSTKKQNKIKSQKKKILTNLEAYQLNTETLTSVLLYFSTIIGPCLSKSYGEVQVHFHVSLDNHRKIIREIFPRKPQASTPVLPTLLVPHLIE